MVEGENVTESLWRSGIKPPICRWTAVLPPEPQPLNVLKGFEASFLFPQLVHITLSLILMYTCRTVDIAMSWKLLAGSRQAVVSYLNMLKFVFLSTTFHRPESYDFWEIHSHESLLSRCQPTTEHYQNDNANVCFATRWCFSKYILKNPVHLAINCKR